jgi:hypothetical protein
MLGPCVGPVVAPDDFTFRSPGWLLARLVAIYGAALIGLWIGEDLLLDGSGNVVSWPGRIGGALTSSAVQFGTVTSGGRLYTHTVASAGRVLSSAIEELVRSAIIVARADPIIIPANGGYAVSDAGYSQPLLQGLSGSAAWSTYGGASHYRDGSATAVITDGVHVYEGVNAAKSVAGFRVGGLGGGYGTFDFVGDIGCALALSAVSSSAQRAAAISPIAQYYNLAA